MTGLTEYKDRPGRLVPAWTVEVQTLPEDTDRILDKLLKIYPPRFGWYQRIARISAVGKETAQPESGSTTTTHVEGFEAGATETYPMVELKISVERDLGILSSVTAIMRDSLSFRRTSHPSNRLTSCSQVNTDGQNDDQFRLPYYHVPFRNRSLSVPVGSLLPIGDTGLVAGAVCTFQR